MDLTFLPTELEDMIRGYVAQINHTERFGGALMAIRDMNYYISEEDNCCSFGVMMSGSRRSFHISMCRECGKYYRTSIVFYKLGQSVSFRYSYYNSWVNETEEVVSNNYIVNYNGDNAMTWSNFYTRRRHHRNISCLCGRDLEGLRAMVSWFG